MNTVEFLSYLRSLDINIFLEEDRLRCNAPEGTLTPELQTKISQYKAEIFAFLKQAHHAPIPNYSPILPVSRVSSLPLSFAQQRLWFLDQLVPNNPFYNVPTAIRLSGSVNLVALEKTFNEIIRRHEALRTHFSVQEGQPVQTIKPELTLSLPLINLQEISPSEREAEAQKLCTEEAQRPFNLTTDLLIRVMLIRLDVNDHILFINLHHIVSDGWSIGVLIQEISALYTAFVNHNPSPLPELLIQYADFAQWQRSWLQGEILTSQLNYWQQQLSNISRLNLPTDRPRSAIQTYKGRTKELQLSHDLSQALEALSQQEGVTLFMTLLAAFKILLYRYTQQEDIAVGSPIANRNRSEIEALIGFFVNSLVLRTNLSGNPTFRELLNRVKDVALGAYAHQDLPFEKLVEELHPERDLSKNPFFQVVFALQNSPMEKLELPNLTLCPQQLDIQTTRFDLEFHLWERSSSQGLWVDSSQGISGFIVYSTDLFDDETISRLVEHFQTLLESLVKNPEQRISELSILTAAEQHQILIEWNNTDVNYPKKLGVHQLFEEQVRQNPDAIALSFDHQQITYQELNIRSNQLAHALKKLGIGAEKLVGICAERSLELIVGILGVVKAGGAYVPLDPNYPQERLKFILEDTQVSVLLTQQKWIEHLGEVNTQVICLEQDWDQISQENEENLPCQVTSNHRVYVIYTSGSTGQPKGVEIEHGGLLNLVYWHHQAFQVSNCDRITQLFGVAFDACAWEIWTTLTAGASLYFPDCETRLFPEKLRDWLIEHQITVGFVPTVITEHLLLLENWENTTLRLLLTGGDKLNQYPSSSIPFKVVNNYGPTENTIVTCSAEVPVEINSQSQARLAPAIGRPIANTQIYILDSHLQPVPIGIPGELYITGEGLARGYLNRPELTAEKFIENPFAKNSLTAFKRLYKTGDLVRYKLDGTLEFLGRLDDQVKIRGYRIELGEIEAVLNQHPAVLQTIATTFEDAQGGKSLVGYVVLNYELILNSIELNKINKMQHSNLQTEHLAQWQMFYNETYQQVNQNSTPAFNTVGWNSSYTNQPISSEQMQDWVNNQVSQILALQPKKVLEIGCGTGLLLFRIAPHCLHYVGTDFSQTSLNFIKQELEKNSIPQVTLLDNIATNFEGIKNQRFDTVILNSIVQYFPNIEYLIEVLEGAISSIDSEGTIFIGDVRSLPLLNAFHASVQLEKAEPTLTREQLQQRVKMQNFQENELVIDPKFFAALQHYFPQISQVDIQLMRGHYVNELTQFRYNVTLHIGNQKNQSFCLDEQQKFDAVEQDLTLEQIRQQLIQDQPQNLAIFNLSNARVIEAVKTAEWLSNSSNFKTVSQIREALQNLPKLGIDPEELWSLGEELGYTVQISWSNSEQDGCYNVVFYSEQNAKPLMPILNLTEPNRPLNAYANNPLKPKIARQMLPKLQNYLAQKLPNYMIPSTLIVLESLPLTANGKIDRNALPLPYAIQPELGNNSVTYRTPIEAVLIEIFTEVLGIKNVGIHDNFFELGGHSLLATQVVSRIRDSLGVELPLRCVFEAPAIAQLAQIVETYKSNNSHPQTPALVPLSRESRRMKLSNLSNPKKVE